MSSHKFIFLALLVSRRSDPCETPVSYSLCCLGEWVPLSFSQGVRPAALSSSTGTWVLISLRAGRIHHRPVVGIGGSGTASEGRAGAVEVKKGEWGRVQPCSLQPSCISFTQYSGTTLMRNHLLFGDRRIFLTKPITTRVQKGAGS